MATRKITSQEQEIADLTGGRYRTDLPGGGVAMNHRPPTGGSTYVPKEENMSGAGRGGQGGPTSPELEERGRDAYSDPYTKVIAKKKGGSIKSSASKRADGIAQRGHTKGKMR